MLHLRDRSDCGFVGKSCIARARDVMGSIWPASTYASSFTPTARSLAAC
jgi:hypothetical protein